MDGLNPVFTVKYIKGSTERLESFDDLKTAEDFFEEKVDAKFEKIVLENLENDEVLKVAEQRFAINESVLLSKEHNSR